MRTTNVTKNRRLKSGLSSRRDGGSFVRCRICGNHLRVISGSHLSIHGIDRETYMEEYRLSPDELCAKEFRKLHSRRRDYHPYGKHTWISAIRKLYKCEGNVRAGYLQDNHSHLYSQGVWLFGDWDRALRAAGFTPEKMRLWAYWDQQKVIQQIQRLRKGNFPLYAQYVMKNHSKLFSATRRQFGSWGKALQAAGIEIPKYTHSPHGLAGVLQTLRNALETGSENDLSEPLKSWAVYYFGSLEKAVAATKRKGVGVSTKTKIKTVLCRMHAAKQSLVHGHARRNDPALVQAAEKQFGSWGRRCMLPALIRTSTMSIIRGAGQS